MIKNVYMEEVGGDGGVGAGAAPAASVAPAADPAGAGGGAGGAPASASTWYPNDPETAAYVAAKGWADPGGPIKSYQHAEKLIGRDPSTLLVMPRADDAAGRRAVLGKLGLPEKADGYKFDIPQGAQVDEGFLSWAKNTFHKAGVPQSEAAAIVQGYNEHMQAKAAEQAQQYEAFVAHETEALKKEWGAGYDKMTTQAKQAAKGLGIPGDAIDGIESVLGYSATMKLFADLGAKMGEDGFVTPETREAGFNATLTPEQAKVQWNQKLLDPNFKSAYLDKSHPGHKGAVAEQARLFALMYPAEE